MYRFWCFFLFQGGVGWMRLWGMTALLRTIWAPRIAFLIITCLLPDYFGVMLVGLKVYHSHRLLSVLFSFVPLTEMHAIPFARFMNFTRHQNEHPHTLPPFFNDHPEIHLLLRDSLLVRSVKSVLCDGFGHFLILNGHSEPNVRQRTMRCNNDINSTYQLRTIFFNWG